MLKDLRKTPFPWFGGKADAAEAVWAALGDVAHYVEPFFGSGAVLLRRPHEANRTYYSETVNDSDGLLVNFWRALQLRPDELADAASWPVSEADLHARHLRLLRWRKEQELEHLMGDPAFCDPLLAGWWVWGQSAWIGSGWCSGEGPWVLGEGGRIERRQEGPGVSRQMPHVGDDGTGVHRPQLREPGVSRKMPHVGDDGKGVNHPGTRAPGICRQTPHLGNDGKGVHRPQTREPGVSRQMPHLGDNGMGTNHAGTREPGVGEFHPMTMPELRRWFAFLTARLRHVRILNGDWSRALGSGASLPLSVRKGGKPCGVFLDPPYCDFEDLYSATTGRPKRRPSGESAGGAALSAAVRAWALDHGADPRYRIVLSGYSGEHDDLRAAGWKPVEWFKGGFLKGGYGASGAKGHQQHRERLWLSPHCLGVAPGAEEAPRAPGAKRAAPRSARRAS